MGSMAGRLDKRGVRASGASSVDEEGDRSVVLCVEIGKAVGPTRDRVDLVDTPDAVRVRVDGDGSVSFGGDSWVDLAGWGIRLADLGGIGGVGFGAGRVMVVVGGVRSAAGALDTTEGLHVVGVLLATGVALLTTDERLATEGARLIADGTFRTVLVTVGALLTTDGALLRTDAVVDTEDVRGLVTATANFAGEFCFLPGAPGGGAVTLVLGIGGFDNEFDDADLDKVGLDFRAVIGVRLFVVMVGALLLTEGLVAVVASVAVLTVRSRLGPASDVVLALTTVVGRSGLDTVALDLAVRVVRTEATDGMGTGELDLGAGVALGVARVMSGLGGPLIG